MSAPNAGIAVISFPMSGGPYANGEIKVIADDASYQTQWTAYTTTLPTNPVWHETTNVAGNPSPFPPGPWMVLLRANQPVNFAMNPVPVTITAGNRTRVSVTYP